MACYCTCACVDVNHLLVSGHQICELVQRVLAQDFFELGEKIYGPVCLLAAVLHTQKVMRSSRPSPLLHTYICSDRLGEMDVHI